MFTLTFSHKPNNTRIPLVVDGEEVTMQVEATSKTEAIGKPEVKEFCEKYEDCRVRRVT